jgi:ABC-type transport system involved in cytochrome c biogenesis permease subunit
MDLSLLRVTVAAYLLATVAAVADLAVPRPGLKWGAIRLLWIGLLAHVGALSARAVAAGYTPITNWSETMSVLGFLVVAGFLILQFRYPLATLAVMIGPLAFVLTFVAYAFYQGVGELPPKLQSILLPVHASLAIFGMALFSLAFAMSLAYLIQERRLKGKRMGTRFHLPPLEMLDRLNHRFLTWGLSLFTLAIVSGVVWAHLAWEHFWSSEPRLLWAGGTWVVYALVLQGRLTAGLRGRRAAALTILGFATLVLSLISEKVFVMGRHGGTFG